MKTIIAWTGDDHNQHRPERSPGITPRFAGKEYHLPLKSEDGVLMGRIVDEPVARHIMDNTKGARCFPFPQGEGDTDRVNDPNAEDALIYLCDVTDAHGVVTQKLDRIEFTDNSPVGRAMRAGGVRVKEIEAALAKAGIEHKGGKLEGAVLTEVAELRSAAKAAGFYFRRNRDGAFAMFPVASEKQESKKQAQESEN